jgi:hypothetical protein
MVEKTNCSIDGCNGQGGRRGFCNLHYRRLMKHGDPLKSINRKIGDGTPHISGYWVYEINKRTVLRHVLKAEKVLGKRLPKGAEVHHFDGDRGNDENNNLVICQDKAYHMLLHARKRAKDACGHADWVKCQICKEYGPVGEVSVYKSMKVHLPCWNEYLKIKRGKGNDSYI